MRQLTERPEEDRMGILTLIEKVTAAIGGIPKMFGFAEVMRFVDIG